MCIRDRGRTEEGRGWAKGQEKRGEGGKGKGSEGEESPGPPIEIYGYTTEKLVVDTTISHSHWQTVYYVRMTVFFRSAQTRSILGTAACEGEK